MFGSADFSLRGRATALGVALIAIVSLGATVLTTGAGAGGAVNLSLEKADSPDPLRTGEVLTYSITVMNNGVGFQADVSVEDKLPNQVDFLSVEATQGSCERNGRNVSCDLGNLEETQFETITIRVRPRKAGTISNTATVSGAGNIDPVPADDSDTETTKVTEGPTCGGKAVTFLGTEGDDEVTGTDRRDVISTLGGDDSVNSLGGKDSVCGKSGKDVLRGNADSDLIKGGGGRDKGKGGSGDDVVKGGPRRDRLRGGSGNDLLAGGGGNDSCRGGTGSDTLKGC